MLSASVSKLFTMDLFGKLKQIIWPLRTPDLYFTKHLFNHRQGQYIHRTVNYHSYGIIDDYRDSTLLDVSPADFLRLPSLTTHIHNGRKIRSTASSFDDVVRPLINLGL
ncbi:hypothetical protein AVEN_59026-1 [Araneus ventricosus]|uniref:Uncharacterized protein n=1 Tax=Araneus ventricosus TaxID=182803 RepID=A0A4Y2TJ34_ARAVE|nr:hypothetical protein AVEN_65550-1 [Araneus ventricosus]GBN99456.1 hypothetical protein AVEN_59026-1 [Araneus ventricosus]